MTRSERAEELFFEGYTCAQSVVLAFADLTGVDRAVLERLSAPFGGGMGRLREVCGAEIERYAAKAAVNVVKKGR